MKRFYALWLRPLSFGRHIVALGLPLFAATAMAVEWEAAAPRTVAYVAATDAPAAKSDDNIVPGPALSADDLQDVDGQYGCGDASGDIGCSSGCDEHTSSWCRDNLICDNWAGPLADRGITADFELTNFYQGVAHGGQEQNWEYGGKLDYFFNLDGHKMGLWEGLSTAIHAETRFGDDVNFDAVGLAPVNANMLYPDPFDDVTAITGFLINQQLNDEWSASAGKFNLFDLFEQLYPQTGRGIDGFMNISSFAPLTFARTINLSVMGAGFTKVDKRGVEASVAVIDTNNSATTSGFDDLFDNGAVVLGFYRIFHELDGLPGSNAIMGDYSSGTYTSLDPTTITILPDSGLVAGQVTGSWAIAYIFEQKFWVDRSNPNRNIGLLSMWGFADDNPSPIDWTGNVGIQAFGMNASRPADSMGVAWFHTSLTSNFKQLVSPVFDLNDVSGVEAYYNAAITPWFRLTADVQVIEPAEITKDTALVVGLRANFNL